MSVFFLDLKNQLLFQPMGPVHKKEEPTSAKPFRVIDWVVHTVLPTAESVGVGFTVNEEDVEAVQPLMEVTVKL
jgi:hypothetical protein